MIQNPQQSQNEVVHAG